MSQKCLSVGTQNCTVSKSIGYLVELKGWSKREREMWEESKFEGIAKQLCINHVNHDISMNSSLMWE